MFDIEALARNQLDDYRNINPGTCFSEPTFEISVTEAYQIQDAVTELRKKEGESVAGYKIGCIGDDIKSQFGMSGPIRGTLFSSEFFSSEIELSIDSYCDLAIEAEMAFKINDKGNVQSVLPVIELHNFVFRSNKKTLSELIANNGLHAGVILPSHEFGDIKHIDVRTELSLTINDSVFRTMKIWPIDNTPEGSLKWLRDNLIEHELVMRSGDMVLAGTTLGLYPIRKGDRVTVSLNDRKIVTCLFN